MRRADVGPVLAIIAGGTGGVLASGLAVLALSATASLEGHVAVPSVVEAPPHPPLIYIDGVRVGYDVSAPSLEGWLSGEIPFTSEAVRAALSEWLITTGTSPLAVHGVESIDVLSGAEAVRRYGDEARGGVIEVTLSYADPPPPRPTESVIPRSRPPTLAVPPQVLNIEEVRRAMFAAFPRSVREAEVGGTTTVSFLVDQRGEVQAARIVKTSGQEVVDQAALRVAGVFRFSPVLDGEQPVAVWVSRDLTFDVR